MEIVDDHHPHLSNLAFYHKIKNVMLQLFVMEIEDKVVLK